MRAQSPEPAPGTADPGAGAVRRDCPVPVPLVQHNTLGSQPGINSHFPWKGGSLAAAWLWLRLGCAAAGMQLLASLQVLCFGAAHLSDPTAFLGSASVCFASAGMGSQRVFQPLLLLSWRQDLWKSLCCKGQECHTVSREAVPPHSSFHPAPSRTDLLLSFGAQRET